jgi:hypothetical protein
MYYVQDDQKDTEPIFLNMLYLLKWHIIRKTKTQSCIKCWKCPPCSVMHAFSFPHVCCNPVNSLFGDVQNAQVNTMFSILLMCVWVVFAYIIFQKLPKIPSHSLKVRSIQICYLPIVPFNLPVASVFLEPQLMVQLAVHFNAFVNVTESCTTSKAINACCLVYATPQAIRRHLEQGRKLCC